MTAPDRAASGESERLATESILFAALDDLASARERGERVSLVAKLIYWVFSDYYQRSRTIPFSAKAAFETRAWPAMLQLSRDRLSIYSVSLDKLAGPLRHGCPELLDDETFWRDIEAAYTEFIAVRYEADLAYAFLHSTRRKIFADEWRPVEYSYGRAGTPRVSLSEPVVVGFRGTLPLTQRTVLRILDVAKLAAPWRDKAADAALLAEVISQRLRDFRLPVESDEVRVLVANAGFFRNRGAYIAARIAVPGHGVHPLLIALLNEQDGIYVDAVLTDSDELQFVFSSTLANFHVTNPHYHELAQFLFSLMPKRPLGLHYSTIGYNHVGKVAVMNEIAREQRRTGERLDTAVGFRGTVAIGFSMPSSRYVMKVIRDRPTAGYKWGHFPGVAAVLAKYQRVHDMDRTGSMLDNIIYYNVTLDAATFAPALLTELADCAGATVKVQGDKVFFKHLITQMKMIPLPVYLETASDENALKAVIGLGDCIKNNAAANVFNKDLDGRNYGVSPISKVYLFDYDAVEPLTQVKVRTNVGREDGEEGVPDWVFEDGTIFLPEEMMVGLRIEDRELRRAFREAHPEIMTVAYWEGIQGALLRGQVPKVQAYPASRRLMHNVS